MSEQSRSPQKSTHQHTLVWLALASILLTALLSFQAFDVRALQGDSPLPTDTPLPPPTATPFPTDTPPPVPTNTPIATDTAIPPPTAPVPTATGGPPPTQIPPTPSPPPLTPTPLPPLTPTLLPPQPTLLPSPVATEIIAQPVEGITDTTIAPIIIIPPDDAALPDNTDSLVLLIDTLVLYSAYFFLGCGFIVFFALAFGLLYLNRRAKALTAPDDEPPQPPTT